MPISSLSRVWLFAFVATAVGPADAEGLPRYDVDKYCRSVSDMSGGSQMIFNGCIELEQDAYDDLKPQWAQMPPKARSYCGQVAEMGGGSYSLLSGCIELERDEAARPKQFQY